MNIVIFVCLIFMIIYKDIKNFSNINETKSHFYGFKALTQNSIIVENCNNIAECTASYTKIRIQ